MDQGTTLLIIESALRIVIGLRFLNSGISNVLRWPHSTQTAKIIFPRGSYFFGLVATALMVLGGSGLTLGFQTPVAALMLIVFLIPTFQLHRHWLQVLPNTLKAVGESITNEEAKGQFQLIGRQAIHSHEVGWQTNIVLLVISLFFCARGSAAFGLDNLMDSWVVRIF
ncbi:MAG: DoxX family protein [Candidatus Binatia bacterium]